MKAISQCVYYHCVTNVQTGFKSSVVWHYERLSWQRWQVYITREHPVSNESICGLWQTLRHSAVDPICGHCGQLLCDKRLKLTHKTLNLNVIRTQLEKCLFYTNFYIFSVQLGSKCDLKKKLPRTLAANTCTQPLEPDMRPLDELFASNFVGLRFFSSV